MNQLHFTPRPALSFLLAPIGAQGVIGIMSVCLFNFWLRQGAQGVSLSVCLSVGHKVL